jgi:hypothetical protein
MRYKNTIVGILLSLILGLSTTISVAHSHLYHDPEPSFKDHDHLVKHADDCHQNNLDNHDGHDESDCVFTVVQYTDSLLTQIIPADSGLLFGTKKSTDLISTQISRSINGFFARAPPYCL